MCSRGSNGRYSHLWEDGPVPEFDSEGGGVVPPLQVHLSPQQEAAILYIDPLHNDYGINSYHHVRGSFSKI